jgi:hypothetical protein
MNKRKGNEKSGLIEKIAIYSSSLGIGALIGMVSLTSICDNYLPKPQNIQNIISFQTANDLATGAYLIEISSYSGALAGGLLGLLGCYIIRKISSNKNNDTL